MSLHKPVLARNSGTRSRPTGFRPTLEWLEERSLLSLSVGPASAALMPAVVNTPYDQAFTASGGSGSYTYQESGALPVGVSLSSTGVLTGTPQQAGSFTFTLTATDNNNPGLSGSQSYTLNTALGFSPAPLPAGTVNTPFSQDFFLTAQGGSGSYTYSETGALPTGMTFSTTTGQLSGTPTEAGSFTFLVTAADNNSPGLIGSQTFRLPIALALSPTAPMTTLPVGVFATTGFTASGGNPGDSYTFSASGSLPPGMSLSSTGQLTGTPTQAGSYSFTVTAFDTNQPALTGSLSCTVNVGLQLSPGILPIGVVNQSYSVSLVASGGSGSYTFSAQPGTLPPGLSLDASGTQAKLKGTPTQAGTYTVTLTATDANNPALTVSQSYTLFIGGLQVTGPSGGLPAGTVGSSYSQSFSASSGTGGGGGGTSGGGGLYTFTVAYWQNNSGQSGTGSFDGLTLSPNGQLTGQPLQAGQYNFTVSVTDGSLVGEEAFNLVVFAEPQPVPTTTGPLTLSPDSLPPALSGSAYSQTITASGGSAGDTYTYSASGALPLGMSLQPDGTLIGTPIQPGFYNFIITAVDSNNSALTGSQQFSLTVTNNAAATTFVTVNTILPSAILTVASTSAFPTSGTLVVQTTSGTTLMYYSGTTATSFTGCIGGSGTVDEGFLASLLPATGTTADATLPANTLAVASTTGFPSSGSIEVETATGTALVNYTGTTATSFTGCTGGSGDVAAGSSITTPVSLAPLLLSNGTVSSAYAPFRGEKQPKPPPYQITASGGVGGYTFQVSGGVLPPGISLSSASGQLTGTPTEAGTFAFVVTATDSSGLSASQTYSLTILPKPTSSSPTRNTPQQIQQAYGINDIILAGGILGDGAGQTIAILAGGDDPYLVSSTDPNFDTSDLHLFDEYFGLPDPPSFLKLDGSGGTNYPAKGDVGETAQDVEWAHALAPEANIILFEGPGALETALNYPGVTVISNSYSNVPSSAANYLAPIGKNVTFVTAGGDNNKQTTTHNPIYPAAYPYTLSVGMTTLATDAEGNYVGEAGNGFADWGATTQTQPAYQNGIVSAISATQRTSPDVSFVGEATTRSNSGAVRLIDGVWSNANGTSLATPAWAALIAIADQGRNLDNEAPLNGPTDTLPMLYDLPAADFHKIDYLENGSVSQGSPTYNQSGLGSPVANLLIPGLVGGQNTITGIVSAGADRVGLAGVTVYLDVSNSGQLAPGDPTTTTGPDGSYSFVVAPGAGYQVRVVAPEGYTRTTVNPAALAFGQGSTTAAGVDFSLMPSTAVQITGPASLPAGIVNGGYSQSLSAAGGIGSLTFSITSGSLPPGLGLGAAGVFYGTPTTAGTFTFTVSVADSLGDSASVSYSLVVRPVPQPSPTPAPSPNPAPTPPNMFVLLALDQFFLDLKWMEYLLLPKPALGASIATLSASIASLASNTPEAELALLLGDGAALEILRHAGL